MYTVGFQHDHTVFTLLVYSDFANFRQWP